MAKENSDCVVHFSVGIDICETLSVPAQGYFPPSQESFEVFRKKIRARPSFNKSLTNYTSEQSLINGVYDKNIFYAILPFSKCQEPVRRERL